MRPYLSASRFSHCKGNEFQRLREFLALEKIALQLLFCIALKTYKHDY